MPRLLSSGWLRALSLLLLFCGLSKVAIAGPQLPSPQGWVVDAAHVLDSATVHRLADDLSTYEGLTSTQIVVVTIPDMQGYSIEEWGLALLRGWHVGQASKNNGVVLVVAPNEHELRIETGYGVEGVLPDATASTIIRRVIVPYFRLNDFGDGITYGVGAIKEALDGNFIADPAPAKLTVDATGITLFGFMIPWIGLVIVCFFFFFAIFSLTWSRRPGSTRVDHRSADNLSDSSYDRSGSRSGVTYGSGSSSHAWSSGSGGSSFSGGGGSGGGGGASGSW